jgi:hypothetical protein
MIDVDWRCVGIASAYAASRRSRRPQLKVLHCSATPHEILMVGADLAPHNVLADWSDTAWRRRPDCPQSVDLAEQFTVGFEKHPEDIELARTEINLVFVAQQ